VAKALLIATGQEPGASWTAIRTGDVSIGAADARLGERVEIWGGNVPAAVKADVSIAEVVGEEHDNIRLPVPSERRLNES
jgi:hypothetical protein